MERRPVIGGCRCLASEPRYTAVEQGFAMQSIRIPKLVGRCSLLGSSKKELSIFHDVSFWCEMEVAADPVGKFEPY